MCHLPASPSALAPSPSSHQQPHHSHGASSPLAPGSHQRHRSPRVSEEEKDACWICLDNSGELTRPCACPRMCHQRCMARWQLQQAGRQEEKFCRFCQHELPDWKATFSNEKGAEADPVMVVTLGDKVHRIKVKAGEEGRREFQTKIRALFKIPPGIEFEVTFRCKAPPEANGSGDTIQLEGMSSYNAATHCASVMAAKRIASNNTKGAFRRDGNDIVDCM